ncbi:hypothetical protein DIZ76_016887 [Coccidioides immitis]|uniref:Tachykinin family protein n=1 Tax=Coccidioides immitis RMSCC 2394 TaxID=404692 RepID=A0A0J6YKN8_COCIT|nr:hypothetical protein CIRG_08887 [Coccidioides immitis RMSCC 2394]TPX20990.1 hypothetical protein DIZ76_016887 [Coccidioides immitis]
MPSKNRKLGPLEHLPVSSPNEGQVKASKPPQEVFHFVSVNPISEVQKSHNRTVIRSHASKYIWRQHRAGRSEKSSAKKPYAKVLNPPLPGSKQVIHQPKWPSSQGSATLSDDELKPSSNPPFRELEDPPAKAEDKAIQPSPSRASPLSLELHRPDCGATYVSRTNTRPGITQRHVDGPFNQLTAWLSNPTHVYPSMLGESMISKLMRYGQSVFYPSSPLSIFLTTIVFEASSQRLIRREGLSAVHVSAFELWPGLVLGASNQKWDREEAAENWMPRAMTSPPLFTAFLYGAAGHMQTRKRLEGGQFLPQTREEKLEQIVCETETIKELNRMMQDPSQACSDEVILAVLCMAFNRIDYSEWSVPDTWPRAPLRNLQWLDVYGGLSLNDHHVKGLLALIEMRGGVSQMKLPGLAVTLSTSVVMLSTKYLVRPRLPFVPIFKESAEGRTPHWPTMMNGVELADDGQMDPILKANLPYNICDVLQNMRDYSNVVNLYSQGVLPNLELASIADRRNWIQYSLLSLPSIYELDEQSIQHHKTYEVCRLAAMIYSMLVIFPLPATNRPFKRITSMTRAALAESEPLTAWGPAGEMLLWSLVLGGMAARNTPDRGWFADKLVEVLASGGPSTWEELKEVMVQVMWMDSVCDMGGRAFWEEVMSVGRSWI